VNILPTFAGPSPRLATAQLLTERLVLRALSPSGAADLLAGVEAPGLRWAPDYPAEADVVAATGYLWAVEHVGDLAGFGPYQLVRRADGLVIGGAGFHGPPVCGEVEIAYAVVASARGLGYAAEAARALVALAAASGVRSVSAVVAADNLASRRVARTAGLDLVGPDGALLRYTRGLGGDECLRGRSAAEWHVGTATGHPAYQELTNPDANCRLERHA
jgi:RimJ/RimL family protein N-acetyltransferase